MDDYAQLEKLIEKAETMAASEFTLGEVFTILDIRRRMSKELLFSHHIKYYVGQLEEILAASHICRRWPPLPSRPLTHD